MLGRRTADSNPTCGRRPRLHASFGCLKPQTRDREVAGEFSYNPITFKQIEYGVYGDVIIICPKVIVYLLKGDNNL